MKTAIELARNFAADLYIVHIVPSVPVMAGSGLTPGNFTSLDIDLYQQGLVEYYNKQLQDVIDKMIPQEIKVRKIIAHGDAGNEIVNIAKEEKVDLIITSTHGRTGWFHAAFGCVAERVVRFASTPVLTIPAPQVKA